MARKKLYGLMNWDTGRLEQGVDAPWLVFATATNAVRYLQKNGNPKSDYAIIVFEVEFADNSATPLLPFWTYNGGKFVSNLERPKLVSEAIQVSRETFEFIRHWSKVFKHDQPVCDYVHALELNSADYPNFDAIREELLAIEIEYGEECRGPFVKAE